MSSVYNKNKGINLALPILWEGTVYPCLYRYIYSVYSGSWGKKTGKSFHICLLQSTSLYPVTAYLLVVIADKARGFWETLRHARYYSSLLVCLWMSGVLYYLPFVAELMILCSEFLAKKKGNMFELLGEKWPAPFKTCAASRADVTLKSTIVTEFPSVDIGFAWVCETVVRKPPRMKYRIASARIHRHGGGIVLSFLNLQKPTKKSLFKWIKTENFFHCLNPNHCLSSCVCARWSSSSRTPALPSVCTQSSTWSPVTRSTLTVTTTTCRLVSQRQTLQALQVINRLFIEMRKSGNGIVVCLFASLLSEIGVVIK